MHVLAHLEEDDGEAGVLTQRHGLPPGDLGVLQQLAEDVAPGLGLLAFDGRTEERHHVVAQVVAGIHGEIGHRAA